MKKRIYTDAWREIKNTKSRFLSLFLLVMLAVAFLSGLRTTAPDMERTADAYLDRTRLMDVKVLSTLGLTGEDLSALEEQPGVERAVGSYTLDATVPMEENELIVKVHSLTQGVNLPDLTEGRLPENAGECVTEQGLLTQAGLSLGDTLTLQAEEGLRENTYKVVGVVNSPLYLSVERGSASIGTGRVAAFVLLPEAAFDLEAYMEAFLLAENALELQCYGQEYEDLIDGLTDSMDAFAQGRAQLRRDTLVSDAQEKLNDAQREYDDAESEADRELADAEKELADARAELADGYRELADARAQLQSAETKGNRAISDAQKKLAAAKSELQAGEKEYQQGKKTLEENRTAFEAGLQQWQAAFDALEQAKPVLPPEQYEQGLAQLQEQRAELDQAEAALLQGEQQLESSRAQLDQGQREYDSGLAQLAQSKKTLSDELARGRREIQDGEEELEQGEQEYADGLAEYQEAKADAERELADAREELADAQREIDDIPECKWYLLTRSTNQGFESFNQDAERMGNLAAVFPIIFFLVAALVCLTTMTRMVEEQRTQIGGLKALGYGKGAIAFKYVGYGLLASLLGSAAGLAVGCTLLPTIIFSAWKILYTVPDLQIPFYWDVSLTSTLAAVVCTVGATLWACFSTLADTPANLMRPKAPKPGKRVFLERVTPLWRRLPFTQKVTMRNLFRYKKRFWMTVIGIGGCTALIVTGFGLRDSIFDILNKQYDEISTYDAGVGLVEDITEEELREVKDCLDGQPLVSDFLACSQESMTAESGRQSLSATVFTVEDEERFGQFIHLRHRRGETPVSLSSEGAVITEKMAELLDVGAGDTITLEGDRRVEVLVSDICENYVFHYVYLTSPLYEELFGAPAQANMILAQYADAGQETADQVSSVLISLDGVTSISRIASTRETFTNSMERVDYAVIVVIVSAAALAFVVLYNLTNINITERMRELATLKVLGFYDRELTAYVYRENVFLTLFGVALGLFMGKFLHAWLVLTVEIDMLMFGRAARPMSYVWAVVLTIVFSLLVNLAAHRRLKKIDMVESMKTAE